MAARPITAAEDLRPEDLEQIRAHLRAERALSTSSLTRQIEQREGALQKLSVDTRPLPAATDSPAATRARTSREIDAMSGPARDPANGQFVPQELAAGAADEPTASESAEPSSQGQDASGPSVVRVTVDGTEMDLTQTQIADLWKQAHDAEKTEAAAQLIADKAAADRTFSSWIESEDVPDEVKQHVVKVIQTRSIPTSRRIQGEDEEMEAESGGARDSAPQATAASAEVGRLKAQLAELLADKQHRDAEAAAAALEQNVDRLMGQREVFKDKAISGLARSAIVNAVRANPNAKLDDVVATVAAQASGLKRATAKAGDAQAAPAASQSQSGTTTKPLTGADLRNGNVLERAISRLNAARR